MAERRLTVSRLYRPRPGGFYPSSQVPDEVVPFVRLLAGLPLLRS